MTGLQSNIYSGASKGQNFGKIENAYMKVDTGKEVFQYDLTGDYNGMLAIIFGELYREKGIWKFKAIGQGTTDKSIRDIVKRYRQYNLYLQLCDIYYVIVNDMVYYHITAIFLILL